MSNYWPSPVTGLLGGWPAGPASPTLSGPTPDPSGGLSPAPAAGASAGDGLSPLGRAALLLFAGIPPARQPTQDPMSAALDAMRASGEPVRAPSYDELRTMYDTLSQQIAESRQSSPSSAQAMPDPSGGPYPPPPAGDGLSPLGRAALLLFAGIPPARQRSQDPLSAGLDAMQGSGQPVRAPNYDELRTMYDGLSQEIAKSSRSAPASAQVGDVDAGSARSAPTQAAGSDPRISAGRASDAVVIPDEDVDRPDTIARYADGTPIIDASGQPMQKPPFADLGLALQRAQDLAQQSSDPMATLMTLHGWLQQGGPMDYQRIEGHEPNAAYQDFANYGFGAVTSAAGVPPLISYPAGIGYNIYKGRWRPGLLGTPFENLRNWYQGRQDYLNDRLLYPGVQPSGPPTRYAPPTPDDILSWPVPPS